ncbi:MAG: isoaspartyl peptidase/L-asparaginase, partial [Cyanobacteria bacterium Co-bin13]|nr:isoaspartyl peptidase/L-asparaginase [Cyanobacteria bacterium Co-bin13]
MQIQPKVIIHGGAGSSLHSKGGVESVRKHLHEIVQEVYGKLLAGADAKMAVVYG